MFFSYFGPKIRSASGAPFGGTYFIFFSRFKFKAGPGGVRFVTFMISSIEENSVFKENEFSGNEQTLFVFLLFHSC